MTSIPNLRLRQANEPLSISTQLAWWTTSGGSTFIPSGMPTSGSPSHSGQTTTTPLTTNSDLIITNFTTQVPVSTITQPSATFTSFSQSIVTATSTLPTSVSAFATVSAAAQSDGVPGPSASAIPIGGFLNSNPVCLGHGLDSAAEGILAALVLPSAIGLVIWVCFLVRSITTHLIALN
jgi:calcium permeable stress-gated cation channel